MSNRINEFYKSEEGYKALTQWYDALVNKFDFDFESTYIDTRFGKTHVICSGSEDAPPLILVQGLAACAPLWYHQIPVFAKHFRVYALDTPGQPGRSDLNPPSFIDREHTFWLSDVVDALKVEKAHFMAVSTGGWFLLNYALFDSSRIEKMILISPTGFIRARFPIKIWWDNVRNKKKEGKLSLEKDLNSRDYFPGKTRRKYDRELAKAMALGTRHFRLPVSLGILNKKTGKVALVKALKFTQRMFFSEAKSKLRRMTLKGLVILGDNEVLYNSFKLQRKLRRLIPSFKVAIIPDSGHSIVFDNPEVFNQLALDYLLEEKNK